MFKCLSQLYYLSLDHNANNGSTIDKQSDTAKVSMQYFDWIYVNLRNIWFD